MRFLYPQAVVGGGAAGLAAALELRRAGHAPTVFEQRANIGGVWDYTEVRLSVHGDDDSCSTQVVEQNAGAHVRICSLLNRQRLQRLQPGFIFTAGLAHICRRWRTIRWAGASDMCMVSGQGAAACWWAWALLLLK